MLKKCLRPCPGLSMYRSRRIKWSISKNNRKILKILFVPESLYHVCILQARIRDGIFFVYNIRTFGSVMRIPWPSPYGIEKSVTFHSSRSNTTLRLRRRVILFYSREALQIFQYHMGWVMVYTLCDYSFSSSIAKIIVLQLKPL